MLGKTINAKVRAGAPAATATTGSYARSLGDTISGAVKRSQRGYASSLRAESKVMGDQPGGLHVASEGARAGQLYEKFVQDGATFHRYVDRNGATKTLRVGGPARPKGRGRGAPQPSGGSGIFDSTA